MTAKLIWGAIPFLVLLLFWSFLIQYQLVEEIFLPSIKDVFSALVTLFAEEDYSSDLLVSTYRVMGAFILSAALAIPLGLYTGFSSKMAKITEPFVGFARYLPVPAFVPLCILWFGLDDMGKIAIIFLGTFFQLILMIVDIAREVPKTYFEAALTLGLNKVGLFFRVLLPAALPGIMNSCRIAVGWAWTYLVVAEIAGATSGLGYRIMEAQRFIQTPKIFAGIIVIGILGVITDLLFKALHNLLFPWNESSK